MQLEASSVLPLVLHISVLTLTEVLPVSDRLREFPSQGLGQEQAEDACGEGEGSVDDERQWGPEVAQHVDVGTDDPPQPGGHGRGPHADVPHAGGEELGGEDVDGAVAGGDGELAQHGESDEQPGLVPGDEDGDGEDQPGEQHAAGQCQSSPYPALIFITSSNILCKGSFNSPQ